MLSCLRPLPAPPPSASNNQFSSPASQGYSVDNTPTSSVQLSPTVNLSREYALAIQTFSFGEIRRVFEQTCSLDRYVEIDHVENFEGPQLLERVLQPNHESVIETLSLIRPNPFTHLVTTYFKHSEDTSRVCLLLHQSLHRARLLYKPVHSLLDNFPLEVNTDLYSLSHSQCIFTFDVFLQFDHLENPFPDKPNNFNDIRSSLSELRQQLDHHFRKSQSKANFRRHCATGSGLCIVAAGVGAVISGIVIATHALVALVASPIMCPAILRSYMIKKEMADLAQLDAAAKGAYFLHNDLDTIDRLVTRLHSAVETDKLLIGVVLERGVDKHPIQEVLKQLQRNRASFMQLLEDLEEHLFLCFAAINRSRSALLQEIHQNGHQV